MAHVELAGMELGVAVICQRGPPVELVQALCHTCNQGFG